MRDNVQIVSAVLALLVGLGLIGYAIHTEPRGEIHYSVLVAYGETLTFVGSLLGIEYHYRYKKK